MKKMKRPAAFMLCLVLLAGILSPGASASVPLLPRVSEKMTDPAFWTQGSKDADAVLASPEELASLNRRIVETPACKMTDMRAVPQEQDADALRRELWGAALYKASNQVRSHSYDAEGREYSGTELLKLLEQIGEAGEEDTLRYGICVRRADLRDLPGDVFATDEQGNLNSNQYQRSAVRVGEPLLIRAASKDGAWFYCDSACCPGWLPAENVAVCADRDEWLDAWDIPDEEAVVVTCGKLYLETTNINPVTSDVLLTMGTVLRRIPIDEYDPEVTGRAAAFNYPVWLPIRQEDGSYARTMALISQNRDVSEGYLPLTTNNILRLAFSMLGDTYGWGAMLNSVDCSAFVRDVYACFGLTLARNTTWQQAMPVYKVDVSKMDTADKMAVLDTLPAGAALYFNGHTMLYLGKADGQYYVISAVSSVKDYESDELLRLGSVSITSLDTRRMNGRTWLEELNTMLVPYREAVPLLPGWTEGSEVLASLMQFVRESADESSENYVPPEDRIAVFDMDGTLYGERFPTYFNDWLYINRALYDEHFKPDEELKRFAQRWEDKVLRGVEMPNFDPEERLYGPQLYKGLTLEEYRQVVRDFKQMPVWGFEGMTYGDAFFKPMVALVQYLYENGYSIYICSGTYRDAVRVMTEGTLDRWIPVDHVIGTDLLFKASGQGEMSGIDYTMQPEEELVIAGELFVKNLRTNKVLVMQREIGKNPILAFGNSSGDFAMANAALQNENYHGEAYMLLCDNTELDYGDVQKAESFAEQCRAAGYHTISMRDDFRTIYGDGVHMVPAEAVLPAETVLPAA